MTEQGKLIKEPNRESIHLSLDLYLYLKYKLKNY